MERWRDIADIDTMHTEWGIGMGEWGFAFGVPNWGYSVKTIHQKSLHHKNRTKN